MESPRWRWKPVGDPLQQQHLLLYEPGNWGDVLKGAWCVILTQRLLNGTSSLSHTPTSQSPAPQAALSVLDPFAGAPSYPLSAPAAARLTQLSLSALAPYSQRALDSHSWPATATLVEEVCRANNRPLRLTVFDIDPFRRQAWMELQSRSSSELQEAPPEAGSSRGPSSSAEVEIVVTGDDENEGSRSMQSRSAQSRSMKGDGASVVEEQEVANHDLLLLDPYDFFDHWGTWLTRLGRWRGIPVLIYLHNKSWRSAGHEDQYRRFQRRLQESCAKWSVACCRGRLAADALAPRSCHEVLLIGPKGFVNGVGDALRQECEELYSVQQCDRSYLPFESVCL